MAKGIYPDMDTKNVPLPHFKPVLKEYYTFKLNQMYQHTQGPCTCYTRLFTFIKSVGKK